MIWIKFSTQAFTSFYSVCLFKWNGGNEVLYIFIIYILRNTHQKAIS